MAVKIFLDFETFSEVDLKKSGLYNYARDKSTDVLCMAWAIEDGPINLWTPEMPLPDFPKDGIFYSWNAGFEKAIWENVMAFKYGAKLQADFFCVMSLAAVFGTPLSLGNAGKHFEIENKKLSVGKSLLKKLSKPQTKGRLTPACNMDLFYSLYEYCKMDVMAMREIFHKLPRQEFPVNEREVLNLSDKINATGFLVDQGFINFLIGAMGEFEGKALQDFVRLTEGLINSPRQNIALLKYINENQNIKFPNLTAGTVVALTPKVKDKKIQTLLKIRTALSKSSTAKLFSMQALQDEKGIIRNSLQYFGAGTGRFAGRGVQIQNLPRECFSEDEFLEFKNECLPYVNFGNIKRKYGESFPEVLTKAIRPLIIARPNHFLISADYAAIENRVIAFIAGDQSTLEKFKNGFDQYVDLATALFKVPAESVSKEQRQLAKKIVLGSQFGMGHKRLAEILKQEGLPHDETATKKRVNIYREKYPEINGCRSYLFFKAMEIVSGKYKKITLAQGLKVGMVGDYLTFVLPSGRPISYYKPHLVLENHPKLGQVENIIFKSPKGEKRLYGGLLIENLTQALARDVLVDAMIRLDKSGFKILFSVHDEIVVEEQNGNEKNLELFKKILNQSPMWAQGLPLASEIKIGTRYGK